MLLGLATIIGGTNPRAVGSILLFCFFALYFRRKHSLLSIYYLETADGLPRGPRVAIVLTNWFVQLALVSSFMTTKLSPVVYQVLAAILAAWLFLPVVRFIIRQTHARDRLDGWVLRWRDVVLGP